MPDTNKEKWGTCGTCDRYKNGCCPLKGSMHSTDSCGRWQPHYWDPTGDAWGPRVIVEQQDS